jgi:2-polyprenyl-3-methyl-5-hydroxy-6-metoxy-1,4-benzoquinol methylase
MNYKGLMKKTSTDEGTLNHIENRFNDCLVALKSRRNDVDRLLKPGTLLVLFKYLEENILRPLSNSAHLPEFTFGPDYQNYQRKRHESVPDGYAHWASVYGTHEQSLFQLEENTLKPHIGDLRNERVLDVGCGTGRYSIYFAEIGAQVTAVDLSAEMVAVAESKALEAILDIEFAVSDILSFDAGESRFDLVFSSLAATHIEDLSALLAKMESLLRPNGRIWISDIHPIFKMIGANVGYLNNDVFYEIPHFVHSVSDYFTASAENNLKIESVLEFPASAVMPFMMSIALKKRT